MPLIPAREQQDCMQAIIPHLDQRFDSFTEDIFKACNVFDPLNWPEDLQQLIVFGNAEIRNIPFPHFRRLFDETVPPTDLNTAIAQWLELKVLVRDTADWQGRHSLSIYQAVVKNNRDREDMNFNAILRVIHVTLLYPLSTAVAPFTNMV